MDNLFLQAVIFLSGTNILFIIGAYALIKHDLNGIMDDTEKIKKRTKILKGVKNGSD